MKKRNNNKPMPYATEDYTMCERGRYAVGFLVNDVPNAKNV